MIQLIQAATQNQSNQHRKEAERQIVQLRDANPEQFFQQVTEIFKSKETDLKLRETSGTLIMVSILAKTKNGGYYWDAISGNTKNNVKNSNLELLVDSDRNIRRTAANIVSAICFIELPRKQWEGIVDKICLNVSHQNEVVKQSSVLALGFICQRMRQQPGFQFSQQTQSSILSGIILGLQQQIPLLVTTSLIALRNSISSLAQTLTNQQVRQFVLKQLVDVINSRIYTLQGLQILGQFVRICYQYLSPYMDGLLQLLQPIIANTSAQNQDVCVAGMEVWENIADQYKELTDAGNKNVSNYIAGGYGLNIVAGLLRNLVAMSDEEDSDDNPISDSANKALQTIFTNGSLQYKGLVLQFVKAMIAGNNWKNRQASIKAFSLLLHGLPQSENQQLISSSINQLMNLLNDNSKQVQYATMQSLIIITQVCGKFILTSQHFIQYLKMILNKIETSQKFLKAGCKIIDNLCQAQKESKLNRLGLIANDLIGLFLKFTVDAKSSLACINWTTITIMNIIQVTYEQATLLKYLSFILQNFDNISTIKQTQRRQSITSAFFTFIHFSLHSLAKTKIINQSMTALIYAKVINTFKNNNDVTADGMFVISALAQFFNGNIAVVNDFWVYVTHALSKYEDHMIFKSTVCCIASFLTAFGEAMVDKLPTFVPTIIELLQNPSFSKQDKIQCLVLMGQVYLSCGNSAIPYLQKFLQALLLCCAAAIQMTQTDFEYSQQLKDNILQALMCIIHGLSQQNNSLSVYIPNFIQFINMSCHKKSRPTVTYLKRSVLLMVDFYKFYPKIVQPLNQSVFMAQCLNTLNGYNKTGEYTSTIKYAKENFR